MVIVSVAQVQTAYKWATFALDHRQPSALNAPVPGTSWTNAIVTVFTQPLSAAKLDAVAPNQLLFQNALSRSSFHPLRLAGAT